jgi:aspartate aminotransferase-like enzyme
LTRQDTFRIGCIGRLRRDHMHALVDAVRAVLEDTSVRDLS